MSPTISNAAWSGTALISACISGTSTMEVSSTTNRSQSSRLSMFRLNPPPFGSTSSSRWMVLASNPVASVMRLAAPARRSTKQQAHALSGEDAQDRVNDGRLAYPRSAGNDEPLGEERQSDRGDLTLGQRQAGLLLDPPKRLLRVDVGPGQFSHGQVQYPLGNHLLGAVEAHEEYAGGLADRVGDDRSLGQFQIQRGLDQFLGNLEQLDGQRSEFLGGQSAVSLVHRLGECVRNPGAHADHRRLLDAKPHRDAHPAAVGQRIAALGAQPATFKSSPARIIESDDLGRAEPHVVSLAVGTAVPEDPLLAAGGRDVDVEVAADGKQPRCRKPGDLGVGQGEDILVDGAAHGCRYFSSIFTS